MDTVEELRPPMPPGLTMAQFALRRILEFDAVSVALSMSFETARTHLKRVMAKTDTHRQSDLVRLLLQGHPQVGDGN